jgi:hypothetical protein
LSDETREMTLEYSVIFRERESKKTGYRDTHEIKHTEYVCIIIIYRRGFCFVFKVKGAPLSYCRMGGRKFKNWFHVLLLFFILRIFKKGKETK